MRQWDKALEKFKEKPLFYKRFIDDGFGIWTHGEQKLKEFMDFANSINDKIKVELRYNSNQIEFLDTLVKIKNGKLTTDLYTKPTDKHIYVHSKSCHPKNVKKAIPYGLALRLRRICENEDDYQKHRQELKLQLRKRGYNGKFIENQLKRADNLNRKELLQRKNKIKKTSERIPLVVTFTDLLPDIHDIVKKRINILHNCNLMKEIFPEPPLVAYRRDRNLADIIVHGKLNKITKKCTNYSSNKTCKEECEVCDIERHEEKIILGDKTFNLKKNIHGCQLVNLIYGLHCEKCNHYVYVGETERSLNERIKEHLADIRHDRDTAVAEHFNQEDHCKEDITVQVLQQIYDKSANYRRYIEAQWMQKLNTIRPFGINVKKE